MKTLTPAQIERLYRNTDQKILAGMPLAQFVRLVRLFEQVYQIGQPKP